MVGKMMRWEIKGLDALILPLTVALKIVVEGEEASEAVEMRKHTSPYHGYGIHVLYPNPL